MSDAKVPVKITPKPAATPQAELPTAFDHLRREIDRLFEGFGFGTRLPSLTGRNADLPWRGFGGAALMPALMPAVDVVEQPNGYEISAELPGLDAGDVEVKFANGILTIKGEKREEKEQRDKDYYYSERRFGSFHRSFAVPDGVDAEKIEANFAKGVLSVRLPKSAAARQNEKKIEVKAA